MYSRNGGALMLSPAGEPLGCRENMGRWPCRPWKGLQEAAGQWLWVLSFGVTGPDFGFKPDLLFLVSLSLIPTQIFSPRKGTPVHDLYNARSLLPAFTLRLHFS